MPPILNVVLCFYKLHIITIIDSQWNHGDVIKLKHFPRHWSFVRVSTSYRWIPLTKASDAERWCLLWFAPVQTVEQTIETPVIWDAIALIMTSLKCYDGKMYGFVISTVSADGQAPLGIWPSARTAMTKFRSRVYGTRTSIVETACYSTFDFLCLGKYQFYEHDTVTVARRYWWVSARKT